MKIDIEEIRKYVPLSAYEKGTEALASSLLSVNARELKGKKGLTYEDLLIKVSCILIPCVIFLNLPLQVANSTYEQVPFNFRATLQTDPGD